MINLSLSILFSVLTVSFFKLFQKYNVNTFQAIIANYATCAMLGNLLLPAPVITTSFWEQTWFPYTFVLGALFISVFYCIGLTAQRLGVSVSMVAAKLSVVIPVSIALYVHQEPPAIAKIAGIVLSLPAVYMISKKDDDRGSASPASLWVLPILVFAGSGMIDTLLNSVERAFIPPASAGDIASTVFLVAFVFGSLILLYQLSALRHRVTLKSVLWGIALGIPNYFSIFFLIRTLGDFDASYIFPVNNTGIVAVSTIVSVLLFGEKLSPLNRAGLALAITAIIVISAG